MYKEYIYVNSNWELLGIQKIDLTDYYNKTEINTLLSSKVNTSDLATEITNGLMSSTDKVKLNGIASGANVNVQSDWNQTDTSTDDFIKNKPTIPTQLSDLSGTLPISRGGTGATTASAARENLEVMKAYTLYNNGSGTTGTVTLSDSSANYKYMDIYGKFGSSSSEYTWGRIFTPNGKYLALSTFKSQVPATAVDFKCSNITISGTSITRGTSAHMWVNSENKILTFSEDDNENVRILRVVGYKY